MSKYKVGDKVKVREDLVVGKIYEGQSTVSDMVEFKGKEVTIERTSCSGNDEYRIKELGYTWTNEMFEGLVAKEINIPSFKIGDRIELLSIDQYDRMYDLRIGDRGTVSELIDRSCCVVTFPSVLGKILYCEQIKLVEDTFVEEPSPTPKSHFIPKTKEVSPKYVRCIDEIGSEDALELDKIYKVLGVYEEGYILNTVTHKGYLWFKFRFVEVDSPIEPNTSIEPTQLIPNKGTIKYRITDDGITYATLGHNSGKSVKSGKDEASNEIGILIATARALGFDEDKISSIVDVLFEDNSNNKAKCENAIIKNDIARAMSILDKYKEV